VRFLRTQFRGISENERSSAFVLSFLREERAPRAFRRTRNILQGFGFLRKRLVVGSEKRKKRACRFALIRLFRLFLLRGLFGIGFLIPVDKKPKFFCQYCNAEVKQNDRVCHHCGRFFASVKCAACGYAGDAKQFGNGCPVCGYAVYGNVQDFERSGQKKQGAADPLPLWMYIVPSILLILLLSVMLFRQ